MCDDRLARTTDLVLSWSSVRSFANASPQSVRKSCDMQFTLFVFMVITTTLPSTSISHPPPPRGNLGKDLATGSYRRNFIGEPRNVVLEKRKTLKATKAEFHVP
jgi:hypothetical protein